MNDATPKKLSFDWRYSLILLATLFFVNAAGSFLATFLSFGIPESVPTQEGGLTNAYTVILPLNFLAFMVATTAIMVVVIYSLESKRAYSFRSEASTKALLLEQSAASAVLLLFSFNALINNGTLNPAVKYLGGFLSFVFGFIDKNTILDEIFFERVVGGNLARPNTLWLIILCFIITYAIWNVALYYARLHATKKGYAKRAAERAELYRESEARKNT